MKILKITLVFSILFLLLSVSAKAETYGELTYSVQTDNTITITGCTETAVSIKIPSKIDGKSVTNIANSAFYGHTKLTNVIIPGSITSIGSAAFYQCKALTSVTIGNGVTSIGYYAFQNCSGLTSVTIGNGVTSIGYYAFSYCTSLKDVYITDLTSWCNIDFKDSYSNPMYYASNFYINGVLTKDIVIPDGVETIKNYAFYSFKELTSIIIPDSVTSIGDYAFLNCTSLKDVYITDLTSWCNIDFKDGRSNPICYSSNLYINGVLTKDIVIPDGVEAIKKYAFYAFDGLTSVIVPDSVTSIGESAFYSCKNLTSATLGNGLKIINDTAFRDCNSLTSVIIPDSVTSIGSNAFSYCYGLISVTIGNSVTSIGSSAFRYCTALTSITIPDSVTYIEREAFAFCSKLTNVTLGNSLRAIGEYAFSPCYALTSVTIPDSVTTIGSNAFLNCSGLTNVTLGNGLKTISASLFSGCSKLASVTLGESVESINTTAFSGCSVLKTITIPKSLTNIQAGTFKDCNNISTINYTGTSDGWDEVYIASNNGSLLSARVIFEYMSPITVTYNANGGANAPQAQKTKENSEIVIPATTPTRNYYTFLGWATDASATVPQYQPNDTLTVGSEDITLYAVWESFINVVYNLNSGDMNLPQSQKTIKNSEVIISSTTPTRNGYIFLGWSTDSYATQAQYQANDTLMVGTEDITLYAIWEKLINIKYSLNGGTANLPQSQMTKKNSEITISSITPSRDEYTFLGWSTDSSARVAQYQANDTLTVGTEDITLYAIWKKIVSIETDIINDIFIVTPDGMPQNSNIIFVCYKNDLPVYVDTFTYNGSTIVPFTTTAEYDKVKVMAWESFETMYPLCDAQEIVTSEPISLLMIE